MNLWADIVLVVHFLIAGFITAGFVVIPIGAWRNWRFVRRYDLRLLHLLGIFYVAGQAVLGIVCPLTVWEEALRGSEMEGGFVAFWLRRWLYYDVPLWLFGVIYAIAAAAAVWAWFALPPHKRQRRRMR